MTSILLAVVAFALLFAPLSAQTGGSWDPSRLQVSRAELQDLLQQYEAAAGSAAYSSKLRGEAREKAAQIRERLELGDFRVGDRIALAVRGEELPDTVQVQPGPVVILPRFGELPLHGVLRSELQEHLTRQLAGQIRDPVVYARSMIRLSFDGQLGRPGFYTLPADLLVGEALMAAGGPGGDADMKRIRVFRGDRVLLDGEEMSRAVIDGSSLDQLNIRAGDRIDVGETGSNRMLLTVGRYGLMIASMLFLGVRLF